MSMMLPRRPVDRTTVSSTWLRGSSSVRSSMLRGWCQVRHPARYPGKAAVHGCCGCCGRGEILAMANPWGTSQNPRFPGLLGRGSNRPFHGKTSTENGTQESQEH